MVMFHNFESFVRMGGYGSYVWSAFAIGFVLLFSNCFFIRSQFRRAKKILERRAERMTDEISA